MLKFYHKFIYCLALTLSAVIVVHANGHDSIKSQAFEGVSKAVNPLSLEEVSQLRKMWNESARMGTVTGQAPPAPSNSAKLVNISVGGLPTVVRLGAGFVSVVSFFDATGKPWPIKAYDVGNPNMVNIIWNQSNYEDDKSGEGMSNTLMMQAQTQYRSTNMVVLLRGMSTPILLELIPGQEVVDYRLDLQIPKQGPFADYNQGIIEQVKPVMMEFLNYTIPQDSEKLKVSGGDAEAWQYQGKLYLRTPLQIISPAWISKVSGANNETQVYEMGMERVVLALHRGKTVQLTIEGK